MRRICAWCKADLGEVESDIHPANEITHGICHSCATHLIAERGEHLMEFLDRLNVPVLLVESDVRILTGNKHARELLGKGLGDLEARRGGEVIECPYAKLPAGCGQDVHCKACTIRNTVLETFRTGESCLHVQAFPDIQIGQDVKTMSLEISTEKVADVVLLRIDDFSDPAEVEAASSC